MEEKSELDAGGSPAEKSREGEKVVIVDPHKILIRIEKLDEALGEEFGGGKVRKPEGAIKREAAEGGGGKREEVVEERPEVVLAETMVEALVEVRWEEDGETSKSGIELSGEVGMVGWVDGRGERANANDVSFRGESGAELEGEGVAIRGEGEAGGGGGVWHGPEGEAVRDDDAAFAGWGGGEGGRLVVVGRVGHEESGRG